MDKYDKAITEAERYLKLNPRDVAHDLLHHENVWDFCQRIIGNDRLKVNNKLLKVAAFWHDVILNSEKSVSRENVEEVCDYLENFLPKLGFPRQEIRIVIETVRHHEFRDSPTTMEGLVLQDADKLDTLSEERSDRLVSAYRLGKVSKKRMASYGRTISRWIPILESTFNFAYAKRTAHVQIKRMAGKKKFYDLARELGVDDDYLRAQKVMDQPMTRFKRLLISIFTLKLRLLVLLRSVV